MSLGTLLVPLSASPQCARRCDYARALARRQDAHLVGSANVTPMRTPADYPAVFASDIARSLHEQRLAAARELCRRFETETRHQELKSYESRVTEDEQVDALLRQARYADLVIASQPADVGEPCDFTEPTLVDLVMRGGRPVLFVPSEGRHDARLDRVLVTWSATPESQRAISDAMPLLKSARRVDVLIFNPENAGSRHGDEPGADLSLYLARNGLQVVLNVEHRVSDIGDAILSRASELQSDLIVMGCFGHSRMRELMMGGASLTVLRSMTTPVLMAH